MTANHRVLFDNPVQDRRAEHWLDTGHPGQPAQPAHAKAATPAPGAPSPGRRAAPSREPQPSETSGVVGEATPTEALLTTGAAAPADAAPTPLGRGTTAWTPERLDALLQSGAIQAAWLPDIRAVAPTHLQIQNEHKRSMLRFSNSIANTGLSSLQVRRGTPITALADPEPYTSYAASLGLHPDQLALTGQELIGPDGRIMATIADAALSEFHPEHRHFHIGETAQFGLERLNASGGWDPITGIEVVKTTFCLIDVNQISQVAGDDPDHFTIIKSPANQNLYNDCFADVQGIQNGWMDRYPHSLPGQEIDVTQLAAGTYRIISTVNPSGWFLESDFSNNVAWTGFELTRQSNGNPLVRELPGLSGGIWFDQSPNGQG